MTLVCFKALDDDEQATALAYGELTVACSLMWSRVNESARLAVGDGAAGTAARVAEEIRANSALFDDFAASVGTVKKFV